MEFGQWIELGDRRRSHPLMGTTVLLDSGDDWKGFRVTRQIFPPGECAEGYLTAHLASVHASPAYSVEAGWSGAPLEQHRIATGSVTFMPAGVPCRARYGYAENVYVLIAPRWFESVRVAAGIGPVSLRPRYGADDPLVCQLVLALAEDVRASHPIGLMYGEALGAALVVRIARTHAEPAVRARRTRGGLPPHKLRRVVEYIDGQLEHAITLRALAAVVQLNVFHFIRAFKHSTGASPHQFLVSKRIERARSLLNTTELPVAQIALECGFSNQSHFTAAFHRATGVTPAHFRRSSSAL
jgi:AraC family transcriptional regulator